MISKAKISLIRSLSLKKNRDKLNLFVVEGEKMVDEALNSSFEISSIFKVDDIGIENMKKISYLTNPSPILAIVKKRGQDVEIEKKGLAIALDAIRDPGNLGTIIRVADWFGIEAIYASEDTVDMYNPKVVQASMGAIFRKKVIYCNLKDIITSYTTENIPVYGTFLDGENIYEKKLHKKDALIVMGSENNGISKDIDMLINERLFIPSYNEIGSESLNVAIATSILCYEFRR